MGSVPAIYRAIYQFAYFWPFPAPWIRKKGGIWNPLQVWTILNVWNALETCIFWLNLGVNELCATTTSWNMAIYLFLALSGPLNEKKVGIWIPLPVWTILNVWNALESCIFLLKLGVNELCTTTTSWNMAICLFLGLLAPRIKEK